MWNDRDGQAEMSSAPSDCTGEWSECNTADDYGGNAKVFEGDRVTRGPGG